MAVDLPEAVASHLMTETVGNIQQSNRNARGVFDAAMGSLAAGVAERHNKVGLIEGRTASGVLATPIAPPTSQ